MYEIQTEIRAGEQSPLYGQITVPGTAQTFTTTAAFFQLLNKDHTPVTSPVDFTTPQAATITSDASEVYYSLTTAITTPLVRTDYYVGQITQYGTPDSIPRVKTTDIQVVVIY